MLADVNVSTSLAGGEGRMEPFLQGKTQAFVSGRKNGPQGIILVGSLTASVSQHQREGQTEFTWTRFARVGQRVCSPGSFWGILVFSLCKFQWVFDHSLMWDGFYFPLWHDPWTMTKPKTNASGTVGVGESPELQTDVCLDCLWLIRALGHLSVR